MNITGPQNAPYGCRGVYHSEVGVGMTVHYEWVLPQPLIGISPTSNSGYTGYTVFFAVFSTFFMTKQQSARHDDPQ
jgi:hypothetical protein